MDRSRDPRPGGRPALGADTWRKRIRRWLRPPRTLRPTRAGWLFFGATLGVGFSAMNTGNNLMYMVLSLLLAFLVLSGVLSESALRGVRVRRRIPREMFAGTPAPLVLEITNEQRRVPSFAIVVEDLLGPQVDHAESVGRVFALRVGPGRTETRTYRFAPSRRGDLGFAGFRVTTRFPFGLFSKAMLIEAEGPALVYPAVEKLVPMRSGSPTRDWGETSGGQGGDGSQVAGLRAFASGDHLRRVHWRASMRRATLLVLDRERDQRAEFEVLLRTRSARPGQAFEEAVSHAASEVVAHLGAGWRVGLRTDSDRLEPAEGALQRDRLLCFLARVHPDEDVLGAAA